MTITTLKTENETWGFYGTMARAGEYADRAWSIASDRIAAITEEGALPCAAEGIRGFLDSRDGRHFADSVQDKMRCQKLSLERAIDAAIIEHENWKISRRTEREYGIPAGMPYLHGWVIYYAIEAETTA